MCDTLCSLGTGRSIFAKNSDRPPGEVQLVEAHLGRPAGPAVKTQYLKVRDTGASNAIFARPSWLFGAEHGVNQFGVAIGNERVNTTLDASSVPDGLIGMDLVRLGLERGRTALEALDVMTGLLEAYGQGGVAEPHGEAYFSSFLIVDPTSAWVLETSGTIWAAEEVTGARAISNELSIGSGWQRGSPGLLAGQDFRAFSDGIDSSGARRRLAASCAFLETRPSDQLSARHVVAHLRDHGHGPWGEPGASESPQLPPTELAADFTGISVCMHIAGYMATTSSMVAELPASAGGEIRVWAAVGSPCVSVYVPCLFDPDSGAPIVPAVLGQESSWQSFARLRDRVEAEPAALLAVREVLDPVEAELWEEADNLVGQPERWARAAPEWGDRVIDAARRLGA